MYDGNWLHADSGVGFSCWVIISINYLSVIDINYNLDLDFKQILVTSKFVIVQ